MIPTKTSRKFGLVLRGARQASGLTQVELSRKIHVSQPHIAKMERGERLPSYHTIRRLTRYFGAGGMMELLGLE